MDKHISILGALYIAFGIYNLFIGLVGLLILSGVGFFSGDQSALTALAAVGYFLLLFFLMIAVPSLLAGMGLFKRKEWARILTLVLGFLSLVNVPLGTALGIYTIWVLIQPETIELFRESGQSPLNKPIN